MKYSLSFLLVFILIVALLLSWLRASQQESIVHDAVASGNAAVVARWAKRKSKLLTENQYYSPSMLLRSAVESGSEETLAAVSPLILEKARSQDVYNALSLAIRNEDLTSAKILLENGLDPNANKEFCALVQAQRQKLPEFVNLLLEHGADPTLALAWACEQPDSNFAFRLLSLGADRNASGALTGAVRSGNADLVRSMLSKATATTAGVIGISDKTPKDLVNELVERADFSKLDAQQTREVFKAICAYSDLSTFKQVLPQLPQFPKSVDLTNTFVRESFNVTKPLEKFNILLEYELTHQTDLAKRTLFRDSTQHRFSTLRRLASGKLFSADEQVEIFKRLLAALRNGDPNFAFPEHEHPLCECIYLSGSSKAVRVSRNSKLRSI